MTFLYESTNERGHFNNNPDLDPESVAMFFNQSSYRYLADKKLFVHYEKFSHYKQDLETKNTNHPFFFMFTPLAKGPYGSDPIMSPAQFKNLTKHIHNRTLVLGWSSRIPKDPRENFGYDEDMVKAMHAQIEAVNYNFPVIEFDAVHASWSGRVLFSLFNVTDYVLFFNTEATLELAQAINVPQLNRMVKRCGLNRTYLRVSETIRNFIIPPRPTRKRRGSGEGVIRAKIELVAGMWIVIGMLNYWQ